MADTHYLVLARKWRPQCFEDVVGQEHITRTLKNAISSGRIHHAFLFIGSRGIGKTTTARILAKALNCLSSELPTVTPCDTCDNCTSIGKGNNIDVIEIDGASNNSVDDVREIRDNVRMVPTHGRYKVYIIDEVHQLSIAAFNALLKTLEEPPPHAIFVLATTEAHKIPATIISRCQRYDFRRVSTDCLMQLLRRIIDDEGIQASDEALYAIARAAEGGVRDSESILDELITYCDGEITFSDVFEVLGLVDWKVLHTLSLAILEKDVVRLLTLVEEVVSAGKDLSQFVQEILRYFRNLLVCKTAASTDLLHLPEEELDELRRQATRFSLTNLIRMVEQFAELTSGFDSQLAQRIALESLLIRVSKASVEVSVDTVLEKLFQLGAGGVALPAAAPVAPATPAAKAPAPTVETPAPAKAEAPAPTVEAPVAPPVAPPAREEEAPPPDPPEAEPAEIAPPAPAPKKVRASLSQDRLREGWAYAVEAASDKSWNLGVWPGHATPVALEEQTILLRFSADSTQAQAFVERPENRQAIESILQELFDNVTTFRTERAQAVEASVETTKETQADLPFYPSANPDDVRAVMEDPGVAKVVDVFKGRIAEVKRGSAPKA